MADSEPLTASPDKHDRPSTSRKGLVALVTGASSGIGKELARGLAGDGARVVIAARDRARGEAARADIVASTGNRDVELMIVDLSRLSELRRFAAEFAARFDRLDILVNNAGVIKKRRHVTENGIEETYAVNHFSHFLLTNLLLPSLRAAPAARIITTASWAHAYVKIDFADLRGTGGLYLAYRAYSRTKLCNLLFTAELARRLAGTAVTANCFSPGLVDSGLFRECWGWFAALGGARSPVEGARTGIHLAISPELDKISGRYFEESHEVTPSRRARREDDARRLWEESERITGLRP